LRNDYTVTLSHAAGLYKALAHPARLRILAMLRGGELCACQIAAVLGLAPSTVSAHLADLRRAGLVTERREGRWIHYAIPATLAAQRVLAQASILLEEDDQVAKDDALVTRLRQISATELCRVDLDISRLPGAAGTRVAKPRGTP